MICELAINAAVGIKHNEIPTGTMAFCCYGHMWLRYRQVIENPTHSSGNILFSAAQLETMYFWQLSNHFRNVLPLPLPTEVMSWWFDCLFVCRITSKLISGNELIYMRLLPEVCFGPRNN